MTTSTKDVCRELKVLLNDDGTVRAIKGDIWRVTSDGNGIVTDQKHIGTKNAFTAEDLGAAFPNKNLLAQVNALIAERDSAVQERDTLAIEVRRLKGIPKFTAEALLRQMTKEEKTHITEVVASDANLNALWSEFLDRVGGDSVSASSESQTFSAALAGMRSILGDARVVEMFAGLNIGFDDITTADGHYIVSKAEA